MEEKLKEIEIGLLQLQRSALIDTQTIMQILIDKDICTVDDIIETRSKIESDSPEIKRIDSQIASHGGTVVHIPDPEVVTKKAALKEQLGQLHALLQEFANSE